MKGGLSGQAATLSFLTLPPHSWGRGSSRGSPELDLPTTLQNAPLEGLGVDCGIWHLSRWNIFPLFL